jgi:hypothetical protein
LSCKKQLRLCVALGTDYLKFLVTAFLTLLPVFFCCCFMFSLFSNFLHRLSMMMIRASFGLRLPSSDDEPGFAPPARGAAGAVAGRIAEERPSSPPSLA